MFLDKPVKSFYNFKGLYSWKESGLIPDNPETGVYASEIKNVVADDGTISWRKGYAKENNGTADTEYDNSDTTVFDDVQVFNKVGGEEIRLAFTRSGKVLFYDEDKNIYVQLLDIVGSFTSGNTLTYSSAYFSTARATTVSGGAVTTVGSWNSEKNLIFFSASETVDNSFTSRPYFWNTANARYASSTATTITISGSISEFRTGSETGQFRPQEKALVIDGINYTYTAIAGSTFTGVTPDPTVGGHTTDSLVMQNAQDLSSSFPAQLLGVEPNIFAVYKNRLIISSRATSKIAMSVLGDPLNWNPSTVGLFGGVISGNIGDGGGPTAAFGIIKNNFLVFKENGIIPLEVVTEVQGTTVGEFTRVKPIISRKSIGVHSPNRLVTGNNEIYYISKDKKLKHVLQLNDGSDIPIIEDLSEQVNSTLEGLDFTDSRGAFYNDSVYFSCKEVGSSLNDIVFEYDTQNETFYFHSIPMNCPFIVDNELYFSSSLDLQNFVWLREIRENSVYSDDDGSIEYLWRSGRHKMGDTFRKKKSAVFMCNMRMSQNSVVNVQIDYGHLGYLFTTNFDVNGDGTSSDTGAYIVSAPISNSYGTNKFGIQPFGSATSNDSSEDLVDIIMFKSIPLHYQPYDYTVQFSGNDIGQRVKIISYGFVVEDKNELPKHMRVNN